MLRDIAIAIAIVAPLLCGGYGGDGAVYYLWQYYSPQFTLKFFP